MSVKAPTRTPDKVYCALPPSSPLKKKPQEVWKLLVSEVKFHYGKQRQLPDLAQMLCRLPSNWSAGCISRKKTKHLFLLLFCLS